MYNKAIYDKHFLSVYYFAHHYLKDKEKAGDIVTEAFVSLFSKNIRDDEDAIKEFLYRHIIRALKFYYRSTLRLPSPASSDFLSTRLAAEFLYLKFQETKSTH